MLYLSPEEKTSKTQDKYQVYSPCTGGILKKQEEYRKKSLEASRKLHEEKMNLMEKLIECFQPKQSKTDQ